MFNIFKKKITIVTHNASFHADDLFGCATVALWCDMHQKPYMIIRSRDKAVIDAGDIVLDVGDVYDPARNRFDHHQKGGAGIRENGIPYASFGLVWKQFGLELCGNDAEIADRIEQKIVLSFDAIDNGVAIIKDTFAGVVPYTADQLFLSFSPTWKEGEAGIDAIFTTQVEKAKSILKREIAVASDDIEGERYILSIPRQNGIVISEKPLPRYLYQNLFATIPDVFFIMMPRQDGGGWKVEAIRKSPATMESRKPFPASWSGLRDAELQKESGVATATFCHNGRFLCGTKTKEDAIALAQKALSV